MNISKMCDNDKSDVMYEWKVCRVCLSSDKRLYNIYEHNLFNYYVQVIAKDLNTDDSLPEELCWECSARLISAAQFKNAALHSEEVLRSLVNSDQIKVETRSDLLAECNQNQLPFALKSKIFEPNHADYHFVYKDPKLFEIDTPIKGEFEDSHDSNYDSNDYGTFDMLDDNRKNYTSSSDGEVHEEVNEINFNNKKRKSRNILRVKTEKVFLSEKEDIDEMETEFDTINNVEIKEESSKCYGGKRASYIPVNEDIFEVTDLSHEEKIREVQNRKNSENYRYSTFKCDKCFKGFLDEDAFNSHMTRHTDQGGEYKCDICLIHFKKRMALSNHSKAHKQKFSCKRCDFVTMRRHTAKLHEDFHNGTRYKCPHCDEEYRNVSTLLGHLRIKHPSPFVCELCGFTFVSTKGLVLHKNLKHRFDEHDVPIDGPECAECNLKFINEDALQRHMKLSSKHVDCMPEAKGEPPVKRAENTKRKTGRPQKRYTRKAKGPIQCEQCSTLLTEPREYYTHFKRFHPDKNRTQFPSLKTKYMCEVCGRMFQSLAALEDHSYAHSDTKQFECGQCGKKFQKRNRLVFHRSLHRERRMYPCPECGNLFSSASNRTRHMIIHTGLKLFKCEICEKCFKTDYERKAHVNYVHLKKPWPKRTDRPRKTARKQLKEELNIQHSGEPELLVLF